MSERIPLFEPDKLQAARKAIKMIIDEDEKLMLFLAEEVLVNYMLAQGVFSMISIHRKGDVFTANIFPKAVVTNE